MKAQIHFANHKPKGSRRSAQFIGSLLFIAGMIVTGLVSPRAIVKTAKAQTASPETIQANIPLIISEYRVRGANGANDEFIEIYNNSDAPHTVAGGGAGYGVYASDGLLRVIISNGTVIPARGHYLGVNSAGYSLNAGPNATTGDTVYSTDIPDQAGIALFSTTVGAEVGFATRLDAVGPTGEANTLFREGAGLPNLTPYSIDYSWTRGQNTGCNALPRDTGNNVADFIFVDTNGTSAGGGQRLGAPGPQNMSKAIGVHPGVTGLSASPVDTGVSRASGANFARSLVSEPAQNSTFGTIDIRHKFTNTTGSALTSLRFRVSDISTFPAPSGTADLRPRTSSDVATSLSAAGGGGNVTVRGTTLDQAPSQPNGGGFNSTMSVPFVTAATPLAAGASINVRFLFGLQQNGRYRVALSTETLPVGDNNVTFQVQGSTDGGTGTASEPCGSNLRKADLDGDGKADVSLFRNSNSVWYSLSSSNGLFQSQQFGATGDKIVPGDYDGDGITDMAVWRASNSVWYILNSTTGFAFTQFGLANDLPTQGDFDGDGRTDIAVFRPTAGTWYILRSSGGLMSVPFGAAGDKPVVGDYDNDAKADVAVFRPSNGTWYIQRSIAGLIGVQFGLGNDQVVPADYDGDGKTDVAVYRASAGAWYINMSGSGFTAVNFGLGSDIPAPGDFDLDGKADVSVFRPSTGMWYRLESSTGTLASSQFGQNGDTPVLAGYVPVQ